MGCVSDACVFWVLIIGVLSVVGLIVIGGVGAGNYVREMVRTSVSITLQCTRKSLCGCFLLFFQVLTLPPE
jgi:hypothetical protein